MSEMNSFEKLKNIINKNRNYLCVGLDSDLSKIPDYFFSNQPELKIEIDNVANKFNKADLKYLEVLLDFNKVIIDLTKELAISYKINFAFYEQYGFRGYDVIEKTLSFIPNDIFTIADAKRGDIGNTSNAYAKSVFNYMNFDSITVSPYMGIDSISPFLDFKDKITFLLCLTSNPGSSDFQKLKITDQESLEEMYLYQYVMKKYSQLFDNQTVGFVVGATHPNELTELRKINNESVFLIPGIGAQGGDLENTLKANGQSPCLINVSRGIIFSNKDSNKTEFENEVKRQTEFYANDINRLI